MKTIYGFERRDKRRAKPGERKTRQVSHLWDRHHEILRLATLGMSNKKIAEVVGVTPVCVSSCLNSDIGRAKLEVMRGARDAETLDVAIEVKKMMPKALKVYNQILDRDDTSWSLKKATADTIVKELGGHEAPKKIHALHGHFDLDEIEAIKKRGKELAKKVGTIVLEEVMS